MSYQIEYMREWRKNNKEKLKQYRLAHIEKHGKQIVDKEKSKEYREKRKVKLTKEDKDAQKEYMKEYNHKNKIELNKKRKQRISNNPEYEASLLRSRKIWREANKNYTNEYNKIRRKTDLNFKLKMCLRSRVNKAIRGIVKQGSAVKDLGCSVQEFKIYIENKFTMGMTWDNYGDWELDHIKPLAKFNLSNKEEYLNACHYTNYQPLWKSDNRSKRDN